MRLKRSNNNCGHKSAASSVHSTDSYGVFGSLSQACSDFSDCEEGEDRRRDRYTQIPSVSTSSASFQSAMERETMPLLLTPNCTPAYKSLHSTTSSDTLGPGELSDADIMATYKRTFEKPTKPVRKKQSSLVTIFSIWNTIMGSSLLTMAWGVERAGLPAALVLVGCMAGLCLFTAYLLLRVNVYHGGDSFEVPALCRVLLGPVAEVIAHTFSLLVLVGANVVYWILITNFLYYTVNYFIEEPVTNITTFNSTVLCPKNEIIGPLSGIPQDPSPYWGLHTTVPFFVAIIVFPLLNFRNVSFFTKFNSLGTLSVLYLLVFVIVKGYSWGLNFSALGASHGGTDAAVLSGMLALSFYIHNIIITIMSNNERQDRNGRDLTIAFALVTVTYTMVGAVFYICFPLAKSCIEDNILNNFEMHDVMTVVARALLLFQVITVYPLVVYMLRTEALLLLPVKDSRRVTLTINLMLISLSILVACLCPNVGTIIRYTGAVSGLVHIFTLPALLFMRSLYIRGELTLWKTLFYTAIIVFGTVNLLMQFFIE